MGLSDLHWYGDDDTRFGGSRDCYAAAGTNGGLSVISPVPWEAWVKKVLRPLEAPALIVKPESIDLASLAMVK